jgi:hypothetical protein
MPQPSLRGRPTPHSVLTSGQMARCRFVYTERWPTGVPLASCGARSTRRQCYVAQ